MVKERYLGRSEKRQSHQMLRVNTESQAPIEEGRTLQVFSNIGKVCNIEEAGEAAQILRQRFKVGSIMITLDRDGLVLGTNAGVELHA